jgi:hypothetical protein
MDLHLFASLDPDHDWDPHYHKNFDHFESKTRKCTVVDLHYFGSHTDGDRYPQIQRNPNLDPGHQKHREHTNENPDADPEK